MPTTKREELTGLVERLEAEIDDLSLRRREALARIRSAEARFEELEERRASISPKVFSGDEGARGELEDLEDEHDALARSVRVAKSAVPEFDKMIAEARERLAEAREQVHREKADELYRQSAELDPKRDELARQLFEVLEEQARIDSDRMQEVRLFDQDAANRRAVAGDGVAEWLRGAFARWLLR